MLKHRVRYENGKHIATIEEDGVRIAERPAASMAAALALRDAAQQAEARSFDKPKAKAAPKPKAKPKAAAKKGK